MTALLAFVYVFFVRWMPFIYFNIFATAFFGILVGAFFVVTAVVCLADGGENMDMKPYSEPQQPGDHLLGEGTYYAPVTYAYPTYSV